EVDGVGQVLPGTGHAFDIRLSAELSIGADFPSDARDFGSEGAKLIHHGVAGVLELEDFAFDIDGDLLGEVAGGNGRGDLGHVACLAGHVAGHEVDGVGEVFPGAGHALDVGLAAELAVGADFASHARDFAGKRVQLIHHGVDGVLELEDFTLDVDGDFLGQVASGDGLGYVGDVAHLRSQVAGHEVDGVGEVFPGAGDAFDVGLAAQLAVGADFASHAGHFRSERAQLIHHRVHGVFELKDFALDVDGDLLRQVAVGDGDGDFSDVAHLA